MLGLSFRKKDCLFLNKFYCQFTLHSLFFQGNYRSLFYKRFSVDFLFLNLKKWHTTYQHKPTFWKNNKTCRSTFGIFSKCPKGFKSNFARLMTFTSRRKTCISFYASFMTDCEWHGLAYYTFEPFGKTAGNNRSCLTAQRLCFVMCRCCYCFYKNKYPFKFLQLVS